MRRRQHDRTLPVGLRRRAAAWVLLSVFVPVLVLTLGHRHEVAPGDGVACVDCAHHVPHGGHVQSGSSAVADCPFCQLSGAAYVAAPAVRVALFVPSVVVVTVQWEPSIVGQMLHCAVPRGPPFVSISA